MRNSLSILPFDCLYVLLLLSLVSFMHNKLYCHVEQNIIESCLMSVIFAICTGTIEYKHTGIIVFISGLQ